jgi:hypothetical protein
VIDQRRKPYAITLRYHIKSKTEMKLTIREMIESDIELIPNYFLNLSPEFINKLGIERKEHNRTFITLFGE